MEATAYKSVLLRATAVCASLAADPLPTEEALAQLRSDETFDADERSCLELILEAVGALQHIGSAAIKEKRNSSRAVTAVLVP